MNNPFMEAATTLDNTLREKMEGRGAAWLGHLPPSYNARRILFRGDLPQDSRPGWRRPVGDTYFRVPVYLPKCMLQLAGEGRFDFLDGAIITPRVRFHAPPGRVLAQGRGDIEGSLPAFFFHYGVPHKYADYTIKWFAEETRRLIDAVEKHFGVKVDDEKLRASIRLYNRGPRPPRRDSDALRTAGEPPSREATPLPSSSPGPPWRATTTTSF